MVAFRAVPVTDASAHALLAEYFASRAASFPASMGEYRTTFPDPVDFVSPTGTFLVIEDRVGEGREGRTADVGCGGIRMLTHHAGVTRFEVKHLWVQPGARGRGLGQLLLDELETRALAFGASELVLDTNATQEAASRLYRRNGYIEVAAYNDNPNATHWFAKNLSTELE